MNKVYYKICYYDSYQHQYRSYVCSENPQLLLSAAIPVYKLNEWTKCHFGGLAVFANINAVRNFIGSPCLPANLHVFECQCRYRMSLNKWPKRTCLRDKLEIWLLNKQRHEKFHEFESEPWPSGTKLFREVKLTKDITNETYVL